MCCYIFIFYVYGLNIGHDNEKQKPFSFLLFTGFLSDNETEKQKFVVHSMDLHETKIV